VRGTTLGLTLALALPACSSSGSSKAQPTTPTTLPAPPTTLPAGPPSAATVAAVRAYLHGPGARLLEFERASAPLVAAPPITPAACRQLVNSELQKIGGPKTLSELAAKIADKPLADAFSGDIAGKNFLIAGCKNLSTIPAALQSQSKARADAVAKRLAAFGISASNS
jgi:hypothetical protein